jgi:hypothetical protein
MKMKKLTCALWELMREKDQCVEKSKEEILQCPNIK